MLFQEGQIDLVQTGAVVALAYAILEVLKAVVLKVIDQMKQGESLPSFTGFTLLDRERHEEMRKVLTAQDPDGNKLIYFPRQFVLNRFDRLESIMARKMDSLLFETKRMNSLLEEWLKEK